MRLLRLFAAISLVLIVTLSVPTLLAAPPTAFNVRDYGAKGDGVTLDSPAINRAIDAASAAGGGMVVLPAGRYLSFSIRLKSNLTLALEPGAVVIAAEPAVALGHYDAAEPSDSTEYQDFGHSHWQNSLIWGIDLENVSIIGPGRIDGTKGLTRRGPPARRDLGTAAAATTPPATANSQRKAGAAPMDGLGNKAIALKNCRNVTLRDFTVLQGGHFALLATGVDRLTIDNLKIDTNRDGFDIDACRDVRISNCAVNAPNDDAIVLKSSYALGTARATENVTITNCAVSGFDVGTFLDGSLQRTMDKAPDRDGPTGRIKFGTESNGGFRNITISNCTFERSRGLALETVDGGVIEDVTVTNLTMREVTTSPIFLRLGNRARGPAGTPVGAIRRVQISHVAVQDADARYPILLVGLPYHPIEHVTLSDIHVVSRGGLTMQDVAQQPAALVNPFFFRGANSRDPEAGTSGPRDVFAVPERDQSYPEPSMFGLLPGSVLYARHVSDLVIDRLTYEFAQPDLRHLIVLQDVTRAEFEHINAPRPINTPAVVLRHVKDFQLRHSRVAGDTHFASAESEAF